VWSFPNRITLGFLLIPQPNSNANNDENRLVKNRQAAQLFRQRQKQHIRDLEDKVSAVNEVNVALTAKVDVLKAENKLVKEQLNYLRSFVAAALQYAFPQNKVKWSIFPFVIFLFRSTTLFFLGQDYNIPKTFRD